MANNVSANSKHEPKVVFNPSDFIFDRPAPIPIAELISLARVEVTVWNQAEDPQGEGRKTFEILRGAICARSGYFKKAFRGNFREASEGKITLKDVPPWVFKVFLTWLYTGLVYIDNGDGDIAYSPDSKKRKREGMETNDPSLRKVPRIDGGGLARDTAAQTQKPPSLEQDQPGGDLVYKFGPEASLKSKRTTGTEIEVPNEEDYSNPVTWPWNWLFDIYVFADQYDTKRLREQMMHFIQLRLDQRYPRMYYYPDVLDTQRCIDRLPSSSSLRRLLVDYWAKNIQLSTHNDPGVAAQARTMEAFSKSFLIECFVATKGVAANELCCTKDCTAQDHDHTLALWMQHEDRCRYHEHGDTYQEVAACSDLWIILEKEFLATACQHGQDENEV